MQGFTEGLKQEFAEEKSAVRVLGFYPGGMSTKLFEKAVVSKDTSSFMKPAEVAQIVVMMLENQGGSCRY